MEFFRKLILLHDLEIFFTSSSRWLFEVRCRVFYIKKPKYHLNWDSRENWRFGWKNENPCLKNFSGVLGQKLALGEVEESQGFSEVKHLKYQNGFLTMDSLDRDISGTIFIFQIGWAETKIFGFEYFGLEVERPQPVRPKNQNGFLLMSSLWLIELIETDGIIFGWVEIISLTFEDTPPTSDQGRWRVTRR